jgi:hypothetical protein
MPTSHNVELDSINLCIQILRRTQFSPQLFVSTNTFAHHCTTFCVLNNFDHVTTFLQFDEIFQKNDVKLSANTNFSFKKGEKHLKNKTNQ